MPLHIPPYRHNLSVSLSSPLQFTGPQPTLSLKVEDITPRPKSAPQEKRAHDSILSPFLSDLTDDDFEELGHLGDTGRVHKVRDKHTGLILARKIAFIDVPHRQLVRALHVAAIADHPNIIRSYGAYSSPSIGELKILMEFCPGRSLDAVGKQMRKLGAVVSEKIYCRLAEGILQGLDYLQRKMVIHRDIRPKTILLDQNGIVKLSDFATSGELVNSYAATFTGTTIYLSPERISGADYTIRSDVWSTGITLLEFVQGRNPFPSDLAPIELMMYITSADPPLLEDENGRSWSDEMKDFIKQMLNVDSHVRPTPNVMLQHEWITTVMEQKVYMARWIRHVWDWPKPRRLRNRPNDTQQVK